MKKLIGVGASSGISFAKPFIIKKENLNISEELAKDVKKELSLINNSLEKSKKQIDEIKKISIKKIGEEKASVFDAHIQILDDPEILNEINNILENEKKNGGYIIDKVFSNIYNIFNNMDDAYFKERASDVLDVKNRVLYNFFGIQIHDLMSINEEVIIIADDLTPSETAILNKDFVKGFLTNIGGRTSHAAIMARTLGIPAVLGLKNITEVVKDNDIIAIDGDDGLVEINPTNLQEWKDKKNTFENFNKELIKYKDKKAVTLDGHSILVEANIGTPEDSDNLESFGAEGVGLYRSEFLYMDNDKWPTEDEQYESYKYVLSKNKEQLIVVRTLDIGGDKNLKYYKFAKEENPFLGYRAIRFCLDNTEIFKTQIRALARASIHGKLGIMFPMIATIDEFVRAKNHTLTWIEELKKEGQKVSNDIEIGMMIEIPSAAMLADKFAEHADFFSIGTNDLIQYSFAVDRMSEKIKYLYQPNNPSLLRLINSTIIGAKKHNKWAAMCGEMAGDVRSIPLLLGLGKTGLDALSMSASSIPKAKYLISKIKHSDCIELADKALTCGSEEEVNKLVDEFLKKLKIKL
ncbi:MAG: phosphoenolpyruvate--protein phosphotransferase [Mycoplasmoidaceae bacterium]